MYQYLYRWTQLHQTVSHIKGTQERKRRRCRSYKSNEQMTKNGWCKRNNRKEQRYCQHCQNNIRKRICIDDCFENMILYIERDRERKQSSLTGAVFSLKITPVKIPEASSVPMLTAPPRCMSYQKNKNRHKRDVRDIICRRNENEKEPAYDQTISWFKTQTKGLLHIYILLRHK